MPRLSLMNRRKKPEEVWTKNNGRLLREGTTIRIDKTSKRLLVVSVSSSGALVQDPAGKRYWISAHSEVEVLGGSSTDVASLRREEEERREQRRRRLEDSPKDALIRWKQMKKRRAAKKRRNRR